MQCAYAVHSLYLEREMDVKLTTPLDFIRRFKVFLQRVSTHVPSERPPASQPLTCLRSFTASLPIYLWLHNYTRLPHFHTLVVRSSGVLSEVHREYDSSQLVDHLATLPALRRLRVERVCVDYKQLFALPVLEHVDAQHTPPHMHDEKAVEPPVSSTLRSLSLPCAGLLSEHDPEADDLFTALAHTSLQHLCLRATLTNDHVLALATLHSLTSLQLQTCIFGEKNALGCLVSEGQPLLPSLQRFALVGCTVDGIEEEEDEDMDEETLDTEAPSARGPSTVPAFTAAYCRQLRHLRLAEMVMPVNCTQAVLSTAMFSMPQLESLELDADLDNFNAPNEEGHYTVLPCRAGGQPSQQPALPALRSLPPRYLPLSDAALHQLLASCTQLIELCVDCVPLLTAAIWPSLLQCRQLLSLCFCSASNVAPTAAFTPTVSSSSIAPHTSSNFPALTYRSLAFDNSGHIDDGGFAHLLVLFAESPIMSLALRLPDDYPHQQYVHVNWPHCHTSLRCAWKSCGEIESC